ncbi:MAG: S8 family serine peptidase [candidate division KSB1 bacterium]|nr:S8 family serine peptidase [candidate division KSB1 bacterium]
MSFFNRLTVLLLFAASLCFSAEKYWIFFKDKGPQNPEGLQKAQAELSPRALQRRAKVMHPLTDPTDLPVYSGYTEKLKSLGIEPIVTSKWLNAVSARVESDQLREIRSLPFVDKVQPVLRGRHRPQPEEATALSKRQVAGDAPIDYGASYIQNAMIRVPEVHALGLTGEGVIVALMDAGFSVKHPVFQHMNILAKRDFINNDDEVDQQPGDPYGQHDHGTKVLSILGGYAPGYLIGPAFGATFILAKTEDISSETPVEEDYWIAAAEWAEGLGADVFNTSLGYIDWYTYADMNGRTAPITIAADLAVQKGVVVVCSAGNEGNSPWRYITAPADGFGVIAVGAVGADSVIAGFSSRGPTSDGRIKPDVVALGVGATSAQSSGSGYTTGSGTSFSSPLVAGAAALILQAHPHLTPLQVRQALLQTANRAASPDNVYGFGLVNALAAVNYWGPVGNPAEETRFLSFYPNPFSPQAHGGSSKFVFDLKEPAPAQIDLYNLRGQLLGRIVDVRLPATRAASVSWDGRAPNGIPLPSGVYFCRIRIGEKEQMTKITLLR